MPIKAKNGGSQTAALMAGDLHSLCLENLSCDAWFHRDGDHRLLCSAAHGRLTPLETMLILTHFFCFLYNDGVTELS